MDYEKKYNEAMERFKSFKEKYYTKDTNLGDVIFDKTGEMQKDFDSIFPELRESEDERIRKGLIEALKTSKTVGELKFVLPEPTREECIAYLEKQKEQKQTDFPAGFYVTMPDGKKYYTKEMRCNGMNVKVVEPKPAEWSEEDEKQLDDIISIIRGAYEHGITISETRHRNAYFWLNNLRPSWKPSEEQMAWLKLAIDEAKEPLKSQLEELYKNIRENLIWK